MSIVECNEFMDLFRGRRDFYGVYTPPNNKDNTEVKEKGFCKTVNVALTATQYKNHIDGNIGLGIVPIDLENNVRFSVIDIDTYPIDPMKYLKVIRTYDLPFNIFRSKSGGLHLYIFWSEDVQAEEAINILKEFTSIFGLPNDTEIFPKQKRVNKESAGNWINLPYFGDSRKLVTLEEGKIVEHTLRKALDNINMRKVTLNQVKTILKDLPLFDAPPCLQSLYICNDPDVYEMYLFNLSIYYKAANPDSWKDDIHRANSQLDGALDERRVDNQVLSSHESKSYSYRCNEAPICDRCNKSLCALRTFGKGGQEISDFTYEQMTQVKTEPPHYKWIVNGQEMLFMSEKELRDQNKFADYCMRFLHKIPNQIKNAKWVDILNRSFKDIITEEADDEISKEALLKLYIHEFLTDTAKAKTPEHVVQLNRVYYDKEKTAYYFKKEPLVEFLLRTKNFTTYDIREVYIKIKDYGCKPTRLWLPEKKTSTRVWHIFDSDVDKLGEKRLQIDSALDFDLLEEFDKEERF